MPSRRLLRVRPDEGGEWDVSRPADGQALGHQPTCDEAVDHARRLLEEGGWIEVVNRDGFVIGHHVVAPPPETRRAIMTELAVRFLVTLPLALVIGYLFHSVIPVGVVLGGLVGNLVFVRRRLRAVRDTT